MILGGVAGKDVFQILALTKWWTEWPIRILFANPLFESGPLLWHLAYSKLERCHPVHLWHLWQILCFYFLLLSSRGSSGMSKTRELTNRISCLDLSPKYRKRPEKLVDVGVQVGLFAFIWVFTFDISFPMFCRPDCLFFFGGGDRLNHRPQSCADGTWTWFAFTTGGIESVHRGGMLYFW